MDIRKFKILKRFLKLLISWGYAPLIIEDVRYICSDKQEIKPQRYWEITFIIDDFEP